MGRRGLSAGDFVEAIAGLGFCGFDFEPVLLGGSGEEAPYAVGLPVGLFHNLGEGGSALSLEQGDNLAIIGSNGAGKSTLLSVVSAARPKIADYPFTTLEPQLGVVGLSDSRSFVVADIPGIIAGAHVGKGLGLKFLQHVERTRLVAVLVPVDSPDPQASYELLLREAAALPPPSCRQASVRKPNTEYAWNPVRIWDRTPVLAFR